MDEILLGLIGNDQIVQAEFFDFFTVSTGKVGFPQKERGIFGVVGKIRGEKVEAAVIGRQERCMDTHIGQAVFIIVCAIRVGAERPGNPGGFVVVSNEIVEIGYAIVSRICFDHGKSERIERKFILNIGAFAPSEGRHGWCFLFGTGREEK